MRRRAEESFPVFFVHLRGGSGGGRCARKQHPPIWTSGLQSASDASGETVPATQAFKRDRIYVSSGRWPHFCGGLRRPQSPATGGLILSRRTPRGRRTRHAHARGTYADFLTSTVRYSHNRMTEDGEIYRHRRGMVSGMSRVRSVSMVVALVGILACPAQADSAAGRMQLRLRGGMPVAASPLKQVFVPGGIFGAFDDRSDRRGAQ